MSVGGGDGQFVIDGGSVRAMTWGSAPLPNDSPAPETHPRFLNTSSFRWVHPYGCMYAVWTCTYVYEPLWTCIVESCTYVQAYHPCRLDDAEPFSRSSYKLTDRHMTDSEWVSVLLLQPDWQIHPVCHALTRCTSLPEDVRSLLHWFTGGRS